MIFRLPLKPRSTDSSLNNASSRSFPDSDFIPYAAHLDAQTLLTKNGEIAQIIRIRGNKDGLDFEASNVTGVYLRDALRHAVMQHLPHDRFAFSLHVTRNKRPIHLNPTFDVPFAEALHRKWNEHYDWQYSFYNEVYFTIIRQGQSADLFDLKDARKGLLTGANRDLRNTHIEDTIEELQRFTQAILSNLSADFTAEILGLEERPGEDGRAATFSAPLEFLGRLVNLEAAPMLLDEVDLSQQLCTHTRNFGFNAIESRLSKTHKRFGAMLTFKQCSELDTALLDRFLQLPYEYILSQHFDIIPQKEATSELKTLREVANNASEGGIVGTTKLYELFAPSLSDRYAYGHEQTSMMVVTEHYAALDDEVAAMQAAIAGTGLVAVREDIKLEDAFWAQLPGNFEFIRRQYLQLTSHIAGLARLSYYPSGNEQGSVLGEALCVLPTQAETPYFFNFHAGANGHSAMIDFNSFSDTIGSSVLHFLLTYFLQYKGRVIIFDVEKEAKLLAEQCNGKYFSFSDKQHPLTLNPFSLEDNKRNRGFLMAWLASVMGETDDGAKATLAKVIDQVYSAPQRDMQRVLHALNHENATHAATLTAALNHPLMHPIFTGGQDGFSVDAPITAVDLGELRDHPALLSPIFAYLLHRVIVSLDNRPTLIVLKEAWQLLDNPFFAARLESLMDMLGEHNASLLFTTRSIDKYQTSTITPLLLNAVATRLIIPDDIPVNYWPETMGLTEGEVLMLKKMERQKGQFLIKHARETVASRIQLDFAPALKAVLAGDSRSLATAKI